MGETYTSLATASREGYSFKGWYDTPEGGTRVRIGDEVTPQAERTLYARWDGPWQTLRFDANGGTCSKTSAKYRCDAKYAGFKIPVRGDLPFLGWFDAEKGGTRVRIGMDVTEEYSRTLYAHWGQTVRFDANGGTCKKTSLTAVVGETYTTLATATRENHKFQGWYDAPEGGTRYRIGMEVPAIPELTLYARWKATAAAAGLSISSFSMKPKAARAASAATLTFEAESGHLYELQWAPALGADWTPLRRWTAETDGETRIEVPATPGESTGFYRLVQP